MADSKMFSSLDRTLIARVLSVVFLLGQGAIFDYFLVAEISTKNYAWIAVDVLCVLVWIALLRYPTLHRRVISAFLERLRQHGDETDSQAARRRHVVLSSMWLAWLFYSGVSLAPRVVYVYGSVASDLTEANSAGPNLLKVALSLTSVLFLTLTIAHDQEEEDGRVKMYLERVTIGVVLDLLDSGEFLDVFFTEDHRVGPMEVHGGEKFIIPKAISVLVLLFAAINMIIPTLGLVELECEHSRVLKHSLGVSSWTNYKIWYLWARLMTVNLPFLILRSVLWGLHDRQVSVLIVKNAVLIVMDGLDLWDYYTSDEDLITCFCCGYRFRRRDLAEHRQACGSVSGRPSEFSGNSLELGMAGSQRRADSDGGMSNTVRMECIRKEFTV